MFQSRNGLWSSKAAPPVFDVAGTIAYNIGGTGTTSTISPTKTDYVLAAVVCTNSTSFSMTCGGTSMSKILAATPAGYAVNSYLTLFGLANVAAGTNINLVSSSAAAYSAQSAVAISRVNSVAVGSLYSSNSTGAINSGGAVTIGASQLCVDAIFTSSDVTLSSPLPSGSNELWVNSVSIGNISFGLWVASGANTTFSGTLSGSMYFGSIPVIFS